MTTRSQWSSNRAFYFAAIGSAFGLGNLWRFPYIVGESGGGAFVLFYLFMAMIVGLPLLIAELMLGKLSRSGITNSLTSSFPNEKKKIKFGTVIGTLAFMANLLLLSYYAVVSGWVLYFVIQYFAHLFQGTMPIEMFSKLLFKGQLQLGLSFVHLLICLMIAARGLQNGFEKWIGYIIPIFVLLLLFLTYKSLGLPGRDEALRFMFYPNFSKFNLSTLARSIGHVFFTLSVGFGAMVAFGSYMRPTTNVAQAGLRVLLIDTAISLTVGILIFPIVFTAGFRTDKGPTLVFETLPFLFNKIGMSPAFAFIFFLCAYLAALGASLGLIESLVLNLVDHYKMSRVKASGVTGSVALLLGVFPAFSSSAFGRVQISGMGVLESLDTLLIQWILPLVGIAMCWCVGHQIKMKTLVQEFFWDEKLTTHRLFRDWLFLLRWFVPLLLLVALALQALDFFI